MIVCNVELHSAVTGEKTDLCTLLIDNIGGTERRGDYRVRMYKKGAVARAGGVRFLPRNATPVREAKVLGHRRLDEPVGNLVAKALKAMNYV